MVRPAHSEYSYLNSSLRAFSHNFRRIELLVISQGYDVRFYLFHRCVYVANGAENSSVNDPELRYHHEPGPFIKEKLFSILFCGFIPCHHYDKLIAVFGCFL